MKIPMILLACALVLGGWNAARPQAPAASARTRESFDAGWRFARFGALPDGTTRPEPNQPRRAFVATASSEEGENAAAHALDGDPATRWCASSEAAAQWLAVDLGAPRAVGAVEPRWEFADRDYGFVVELSGDGRTWAAAGATPGAGRALKLPPGTRARYLRIRTTRLPPQTWASLKELLLYDAAGRPLENPEVPSGRSPADPGFDDRGWRPLDLPHDWGVEGPFRMDLENETGKLPWPGIGWYRKTFVLPAADTGRRVFLDFDGAMSQPKVYVNGRLAGEWKYGYNSFRVDITPFVQAGATNLVAVRLDNPPRSSRWYPGGGIYRHVWLVKAPPVHVAHWGVCVTTPKIAADQATVRAEVVVQNDSAQPAAVPVTLAILDGGNPVATAQATTAELAPGVSITLQQDLLLPSPKRWDLATPHLYTLRVTLAGGDAVESRFGVREIAWDVERGFLLNGRKVVLQGVCNHHDLGPLGGAVHRCAIQRQLELLKEMGCNAIRTSHNPPAPELLELCDEMGFLVLDELFDAWKLAKKPNDYHRYWDDWHERDVRNFVLRDRNHPCVIAWSTGNEIPELGATDYHWVPKKLYDLIRQYDPTRPVTAGSNQPGASNNGFQQHVDVFGLNYHLGSYGSVAGSLPDKPLYASETSSCVSSRGEYFFPVDWDKSKGFYQFQVSSYDLYAPGWAYRPDLQFETLDKNPRYAGEFVWTGFDYLGEPTPYNLDSTNAMNFQNEAERKAAMEQMKKLGNRAPSRSSYFGILDLCGFPKDRFYLYQARWRPELPMVHILPHWNWPERVGQVTPVHVYTSGDEVELFLNGQSLGRKRKGEFEYRLHWDDVKYRPGEVKAVAYKGGRKWAEAVCRTTGPAAKVILAADRPTIRAGGEDLCYVTVQVSDTAGRPVPRSKNPIQFAVAGPVEIVAVCNGDPTDFTPFQGTRVRAFNGLAQVILRSRRGAAPGPAQLQAVAPGLAGADLALDVEAPPPVASPPPAP